MVGPCTTNNVIQFTRNGSEKGHPLTYAAVSSYASLLSPILGVVHSLLPYEILSNSFFFGLSEFSYKSTTLL